MKSSDETKDAQDTQRSCWDYSPKELREMPNDQANRIIDQRMQDNARKARERYAKEKEAGQ